MKLSIIIPVYNSEKIVGKTIDEVIKCCKGLKSPFEVIAVNDGSSDKSWSVLLEKAKKHGKRIKVINLLRNVGQHSALLCGFSLARGQWVVTLDDDMQIHPREISKLLKHASDDVDLVVGQYAQKQHGLMRCVGSNLVQKMNEKIFGKPRDFAVTSFRMLRRDVVDRILQWNTPFPYINGMMLLGSSRRMNVIVGHQSRKVGKSGYTIKKIIVLLMRILFTYSSYPLRVALGISLAVCVSSLVVGGYFMTRKLMGDTRVEGWTSLVALIAFLNSFIVVLLAMIGEYVLNIFRQVTREPAFQIKEIYQDQAYRND